MPISTPTASPHDAVSKPVQLGPRHTTLVSKLICETWNAMPPEERHWLKLKSPNDIGMHFIAGAQVFGMFNSQRKLVACCILHPLSDAQNENNQLNYPYHLQEKHWAVQSVAIHPEYRGRKLMKEILSHVEAYAKAHPFINRLVAKVHIGNDASLNGFLARCFSYAIDGLDAATGKPVCYLDFNTASGLVTKPSVTLQSGYDQPALASLS